MLEDEYWNGADEERTDTDDGWVGIQDKDSDRPLSDSEHHQTKDNRATDGSRSTWSKFHNTEEQ
jgi:hypothetical protein